MMQSTELSGNEPDRSSVESTKPLTAAAMGRSPHVDTHSEGYVCIYDHIGEFRFMSSWQGVICVGPVKIVSCWGHYSPDDGNRRTDAIVTVQARNGNEAMRVASESLRRAIAILDCAIYEGGSADRSPSTDYKCFPIQRFGIGGNKVTDWDMVNPGNKIPERCMILWRDSQEHRIPATDLVLSEKTFAVDMSSRHIPELIDICMPPGTTSRRSKLQQSLSNAIFAAVNQLHKSIRHDLHRDGRELALLRAITGLEALFTELGAHNAGTTASAVGYGSAFASLLCQTSAQRTDRWNRVQELYRTWGNIVHGSTTVEPSEQDVLDARRILADSIEACVAWYDGVSETGLQEWVTRRRFGCSCGTTES